MDHCNTRIGDAYFRTPRTTIKSFVDLLSILDQNPGATWQELIGETREEKDTGPVDERIENETTPADDDELASFRL